MNRREFFGFLGRLSSGVVAAKLLPTRDVDPFSLRASGPHEIDFHRGGIFFDPISFNMAEYYTIEMTFDKPFLGSTPVED